MRPAQEYGFGDVSHMLSLRMDGLVAALGLKGSSQGDLFTPLNPTRGDRHPGSFVITMSGASADEIAALTKTAERDEPKTIAELVRSAAFCLMEG